VYFDSLTMFVAFLLAGRWIELRARHRAMGTIEGLSGRAQLRAWRLRDDGGLDEVSGAQLRSGDRVRVPLGEAFPADGPVEQGATQVDESLLTGESRPVDRGPGDTAVAGSVNLGAPVVQRVERVGADTRQEQIAALMREALTRRPDALRLADRLAGPFLFAVLLLAAGAAAYWWAFDPSRALAVAVAVLIVTCPCALSLATPAASLATTAALARRGLMLRRIEALETLARADHVMLDKTGTLTESQPHLRAMRSLARDANVEALAARASALAAWSSHPLSQALAQAVPADATAAWQAVVEVPGCGLEAQDTQGQRWRLGSARWLGVAAEESGADLLCFGPPGAARVAFEFDDERVVEGAAAGVQALRAAGLQVSLLSGDSAPRVQRLAAGLGVQAFVAEATPLRKLDALRVPQACGDVVVMVGDGVNDAPVLAQADVSFALAHGARIAHGAADAVLLSGRISDVAHAVHAARCMLRVARQNLMWAALYNAVCVPLALVGWMPPWAAGLGMAASSALVVLNGMRLAKG
jgi:Cu2+-exporting ATPase